MSLYREYLLEKTDKDVVENENGFAVYSMYDKTTIFVEDVYVKPEMRKCYVASMLVDEIAGIGKERGCTKMITTVRPSLKNSILGLKAVLAYGFELDSAANDLILFRKTL